MQCDSNIFSSKLKEAKDLLLEFESVLNAINDLHDSNNLSNQHLIIQNTNGTSTVDGVANRNYICLSSVNDDCISSIQSTHAKCDGVANCNDICLSEGNDEPVCSIQSSDTNPCDVVANHIDICLSEANDKPIHSIQSSDTTPCDEVANHIDICLSEANDKPIRSIQSSDTTPCDEVANRNSIYPSKGIDPCDGFVNLICLSKGNDKSIRSIDSSDINPCDEVANLNSICLSTGIDPCDGVVNRVCLSKGNDKSTRSNYSIQTNLLRRNDDKYSNVASDNSFESKLESTFGDAFVCNGNDCSYEKVMGVEQPTTNRFVEKHLERVLKEATTKNLVNYFYYLRDINDEHDKSDDRMDIDVNCGGSTTLLIDQNHTSHEECGFALNVDGDRALAISLIGETTVMDMDSIDTSVTANPSSNSIVVNFDMAHRQYYGKNALAPAINCYDKPVVINSVEAQGEYDDKMSFVDSPVAEVCDDDFIEFETDVGVKRNRGCDNSKMFVPTSDAGPKMYCCMYCKVRVQKLERHLRNVHKNEKDVKKYLSFPPRSAPRRKILLRILKHGDFIWSNDEKLNQGEYAVRRRSNKKFPKKPWDLIPCPVCLGAYSKSYLSRHWKNECSKNPLIGERGIHQAGRAVEGRLHADASQDLVDIFATFKKHENIRPIRFDWLVICYGNELCLNHSPHFQEGYIRSKLRAAATVLSASKSISSELTDMSSLFHVKHCNTVVDAIRSMGNFDPNTKRFGSPATASSTVTLINAIGEMLIVETMKSDDPEKERDVERFLKVFKKDVKTKINKLVAVSRLENKRHKKEIIPTTADVSKLATYLDSEREACFSRLSHKYCYDDWLKLSQLTMVSILIYNRRRSGELQNLLMKDFEQRDIVADQCDMLLNDIPDAAKRNIKSCLAVRNKLGKKMVPVMLKHKWDDCLELLVHYRREALIPENNEFLFALPTRLKKIRTTNVCAIMRSFSLSCGAENPSSLRGTYLRKHVASFASTKNLSDSDITNLADFMGHAEAVHRTYYRINPLTNQVGKISFLLDSALGNETPRGSADDSDSDTTDESACEFDEFESDSESEMVIPLKASRKTSKKNTPKVIVNKQKQSKKPKVKPRAATKLRKKGVGNKRKQNISREETGKKKRKTK